MVKSRSSDKIIKDFGKYFIIENPNKSSKGDYIMITDEHIPYVKNLRPDHGNGVFVNIKENTIKMFDYDPY